MTGRPIASTLAAAALTGLVAAPALSEPGPQCIILFAQDTTHPEDADRSMRLSIATNAGAGPDGIAVAKRIALDAAARTDHEVLDVLVVPLPEESGSAWTPQDVTPSIAAIHLRHTPGVEHGSWSVLRDGHGGELTARALEDMPAHPLAHFCDDHAMREALTYAARG